jgi:RHS repeat-associated protein
MGNTRVASIVKHKDEPQPATYYYASDHLGSSSVLTNNDGSYYERLEYLPYGEVWVEDAAINSNYRTPYKFTGKELDKETGLYYFGARYYDARISRWISTDPAIEKFLPIRDKDKDKENDKKLPAGGVYEPSNNDLYGYVGNNPVIFIDPDGNFRFGKRPLVHIKMLQIIGTGLMLAFAPQDFNIKTMDTLNVEVVHEHGFYDNSPENIGYGDEGFMTQENKSEYKIDTEVYDDILMKKAEKNVKGSGQFDEKGEKYKFVGNNCQDFADALRKEYNKLYEGLSQKEKKEVDARVEQIRQKIQQEEKKR